jgi:glucose/arabinose dehydrogenase
MNHYFRHIRHYTPARMAQLLSAGSARVTVLLVAIISLLSVLSQPARAATLPSGFVEARITSQLANPTAMAIAPDGRVFVTLQGGQIRVIKQDALLPTPFATLTVDWEEERGLLGIAFDPNFVTNQYIYVYYTTTTPTQHNRITRLTANGDVAVPGSETAIFELSDLYPDLNTHNGGALNFGLDGKLYVAVGDNNYPRDNAQRMTNHFGKILRLNKDGTIPSDNPFYTTAAGANRAIWALGLRNPFTFAIQRGTGRIFINDVGGDAWEEVNEGVAGANYGWPTTEGPTTDPRFTSPRYAYRHGSGSEFGCAVTGGTFYNPATAQFPNDYIGTYFFADYCSGWIKRFNPATKAVMLFASSITTPIGLAVSPDGSLYYLSAGLDRQGNGAVYKVQYRSNQAPQITQQPSNVTASLNGSATFTVSTSGSTPLSYQWQRNGVTIPGATSASYTLSSVTQADHGAQFRASVSNAYGSVTSAAATLTVTTNQRPGGTISSPASGTLYTAGQSITFSGTGTDAEDGALPASAFAWRVDFHHDTHVHPFMPTTSGMKSGAFTIPTLGETSANVWYRISMTVRDSQGLTHETYRDLRPRTVTLTFTTKPAGLQVTLDEQPVTTPYSTLAVVGVTRTLGVVSPQVAGGQVSYFTTWTDGGAATHPISTPNTNTTYTAEFGRPAVPGRFEAEDYRAGGPGAGYVDTTSGNSGGQYRTDDVDIQQTSDTSGSYNVGWIAAGEWLAYDVHVQTSARYAFSVRVASPYTGKTFRIQVDGVDASSPVTVPNTGGWQTWSDVTSTPIPITAGDHTITLVTESGNFNLNYVTVTPSIAVPGRFEAEDYRAGGPGVGYVDSSNGNSGGVYRADDVDIQSCSNGSPCYNVGWVTSGEWLAYDVTVATSGNYTFGSRVAALESGKRFHLEIDGVNVSGSLAVPQTGSWQTWTHVWTGWIPVTAGPHTVRVVAETDGFNLNAFEAWRQ